MYLGLSVIGYCDPKHTAGVSGCFPKLSFQFQGIFLFFDLYKGFLRRMVNL